MGEGEPGPEGAAEGQDQQRQQEALRSSTKATAAAADEHSAADRPEDPAEPTADVPAGVPPSSAQAADTAASAPAGGRERGQKVWRSTAAAAAKATVLPLPSTVLAEAAAHFWPAEPGDRATDDPATAGTRQPQQGTGATDAPTARTSLQCHSATTRVLPGKASDSGFIWK